MFREMRRKRQLMSEEKVNAVLERNTHGILGVLGDEGYPYAVPVSYFYQDGKVFIHSAKAGHKVDAIQKEPKVSFTVVDEDTVVSEKFTSYFRSVIAFGRAYIVTDEEERKRATRGLIEKYCHEVAEEKKEEEMKDIGRMHVVCIEIEHITGKEAIEYVAKG